jgi:hypothetical protein
MAAPKGNNYGRQTALFRDALRRAMSRDGGNLRKGLDRIASKLVERAVEGDAWAIGMIMDRVDGRAVQPIQGQIEQIHTVRPASAETLSERLDAALAARALPTPAPDSIN